MDYIAILGIAIGLAMDAFAASITSGAIYKKINITGALKISFSFGFFQFFMPIIGWYIGKASEEIINKVDHWVAFILLCYIGGKMMYDANSDNNNYKDPIFYISYKNIMILSIATSIDALATGIILPSAVLATNVPLMLLSTSIIGVITFFISLIGIYIGKNFGSMFSSKAELIGGIILIIIGTKILIEGLI